MAHQIPQTPEAVAGWPHAEDGTTEMASDLANWPLRLVNVAFFGQSKCRDRDWVLIDTGNATFTQAKFL